MLTPALLVAYVGVLAAVSNAQVTSDPATAAYSFSTFAIGDWGTTTFKGSCCSRSDAYNNYDVNAEDVVATLMDIQAGIASVKPKLVIGHGDNFYWTGINSLEGRDSRFTTTFEEKFDGANIKSIPWVNVLGNHDYGGASYVCNSGDNNAKCESTEALLQGIDNKFNWQRDYTSPNDNRWNLDDHFYVKRIEDPATGISIDVFNVDTNDADIHGAMQICCQCYGYSNGDSATCRNVGRGHQYCCGGDNAMFDSCMAKFNQWGDDSRRQIAEKVKASTATWKIVNSHYSPYNHYAEGGMNKWFDALRGSGVHVWLNGHTHGEKHDYSQSLGIHFIENGAGGGIQKESASGIPAYAQSFVKNEWTYGSNEYGFMSLEASKDWIKLQYHTADDAWQYGDNFQSTKIGGGVFTRGAPLIGLATAGPAAYAFFSRTTMNLLEKDDAWASAFGGFACGAIIGMPLKRFAPVMALGAASGAAHGAFYLFGNRIDSFKSDEDEFERKMVLRKTTRVPLEQTISEIGEGRGIRPPGYEERRRQRLKERYDFDVDPVSANAEGSQ